MKNIKMRLYTVICTAFVLMNALSLSAQYRTDYSSLTDSDKVKQLKEHVSYLSSAALEGRAAGSEGETAAAAYVYSKFSEYGLEMLCGKDGEIFGITLENGDTLTSRNVVGCIQGRNPAKSDRYIVVGARLDNLGVNVMTVDGERCVQTYNGANGNASGLALMIELAARLKSIEYSLERSVIFVAFGAGAHSFAGSWYFLNRAFSSVDKIDAMINLDMIGTGVDEVMAFTASNPDLNALLNVLRGELQPVTITTVAAEPYASDHRSFYSKEIPSVYLTSGFYPEHNTPSDTESIINYGYMEKVEEFVVNLALALSSTDNPPLFSNDKVKDAKGRAVQFADCDRRPTFLGSSDPRWFLKKWVYQYLKYPKEAVEKGIQGRVVVKFTIAADGSVKDASVVKGVDPLLDAEALKVVNASPKWKPGMVSGKKVDAVLNLSIEFRLSKDSGKFGIKK